MEPLAWEALDPDAPGLDEARLVLHHAVQLVAAVGQSLAPPAPDDSQQSLTLAGQRVWQGAPVGPGVRAVLDPVALELCLAGPGGATFGAWPLAGRTMAEGLSLLAAGLAGRGLPGGQIELPRHPEDFPVHRLAAGATFPSPGALPSTQVARLFAGTAGLLASLGADPARLWPHHFDLAARVGLGRGSVLLGASPGDGSGGRAYWYATPDPRPDRLPPLLGGGAWRREGWFGAELPLERLARDSGAQRRQVGDFYRSVLEGLREAR